MKRCSERVHVETSEAAAPKRFLWRGQFYQVVNVEEQWRYAGEWWYDGKGRNRRYFRVTARAMHSRQTATFQLYEQYNLWTLSAIYD